MKAMNRIVTLCKLETKEKFLGTWKVARAKNFARRENFSSCDKPPRML